jgi:hypothetical protein
MSTGLKLKGRLAKLERMVAESRARPETDYVYLTTDEQIQTMRRNFEALAEEGSPSPGRLDHLEGKEFFVAVKSSFLSFAKTQSLKEQEWILKICQQLQKLIDEWNPDDMSSFAETSPPDGAGMDFGELPAASEVDRRMNGDDINALANLDEELARIVAQQGEAMESKCE